MQLMIYKKLRITLSFCSWSNCSWSKKDGVGASGMKVSFLLLSALSLSGLARGQATGVTITSLPYLLTNQGGVVVDTSYPVKPTPPAVGVSGFASLFGGGFGSLLSAYPVSNGGATAMFTVDHLLITRSANAAIKQAKEYYVTTLQSDTKENNTLNTITNNGSCSINPTGNVVRLNRIKARRVRNALPLIAASDTCELPEETNAEDKEEELEVLSESETATENAIEDAEAAVDVAEEAAEAAETAAEGALEGVEILDAILETCSLF